MTASARIGGGVVALASALACSPSLDSQDSDLSKGETWEPGVLYVKAEPPATGAWFGYSLVWGGDALAVTAPREDIFLDNETLTRGGAVYLLEPSGETWTQTRFEMPNVDPEDGVVPPQPGQEPTVFSAIHAALDDRLLIVGVSSESSATESDPFDNSLPQAGALYVFDRARPSQSPRLMKAPVPREGVAFGFSLALSDDWLIVGAPGDQGASADAAPDTGVVYAYRRNGDAFEPPQTIAAPNAGPGDKFGAAVSLEGDLLAVGAPFEDSGALEIEAAKTTRTVSDTGAVYVYRLIDGSWTFEDYLKSGALLSVEWFGYSVSVSGDAIAVGASGAWSCPGEGAVDFGRGAAHVFREQSDGWKLEQCLGPDSNRVASGFGQNVALRNNELLVGALFDSSVVAAHPTDEVPDDKAGAAYRFTRSELGTWSRQRHFRAPNAAGFDFFGTGVAFLPGYVAVGAVAESGGQSGPSADPLDNTRPGAGAVYLFPVEP